MKTEIIHGIEKIKHTNALYFHILHILNAGHSKWDNIRHTKGKNDAKKSNESNVFASRIQSSVKAGGITNNSELEMLLEKARKLNIQKKMIDNAIKRGLGQDLTEDKKINTQYEFIGSQGISFIITASTDNKNRTISKLKSILNRINAKTKECSYLFEKKGIIEFELENKSLSDEKIFDLIIESGVEDFEDLPTENSKMKKFKAVTHFQNLNANMNNLAKSGFKLCDSNIAYIPKPENVVTPNPDLACEITKIKNDLECMSDIISFHSNIKDN